MPEGDDRTISNLLLDQIEFADVILLNKTDLLDPTAAAAGGKVPPSSGSLRRKRGSRKQADTKTAAAGSEGADAQAAMVSRLVGMLHQLNPRAKVLPTSRCAVQLREVVLTGLFDMEQVMRGRTGRE